MSDPLEERLPQRLRECLWLIVSVAALIGPLLLADYLLAPTSPKPIHSEARP